MDKNAYFKLMKETSGEIIPFLINRINDVARSDKRLQDILFFFVSERLKKRTFLKPFILRLSYQVCGGTNWEKIVPIGAAIELLNISSYQANSAFDEKYKVLSKAQKDNQFIASMIIRELASDIVLDTLKHEVVTERILQELGRINKYIYIGQHYDLNVLQAHRFDLSLDLQDYMPMYLERCYGLSGSFNEYIMYIGGLLAGAEEEKLKALKEFGKNFGIALQIVNDIGDLIPPGLDSFIAREYQDFFSDIKNGRLTLPIFYSLKFGKKEDTERIMKLQGSSCMRKQDIFEVTRLLNQSGGIPYARKVATQFAKRAKQYLGVFDLNMSRTFLSVLLSMITTNKYFVALRKLEELDVSLERSSWTSVKL